jgi:hypothetical protein
MISNILITRDKINVLKTNLRFNCAKTAALKSIDTTTHKLNSKKGKKSGVLFIKIYIAAIEPMQLCKMIVIGI